jgi:hypothetical protein
MDDKYALERELSSKALFLIKSNKKEGSFTSKDKRLFINYDSWEDHMTIFKIEPNLKGEVVKSNVVFESKLGKIKTFMKEDQEWIKNLRFEHAKRK